MTPPVDAARQFRDALVRGDATAFARIVERIAEDPAGATRWLKLRPRGRPKANGRAAELLRRLATYPRFAGLSTAAAARAIAAYLSRYSVSGWQFERDATSNPHDGHPNDARGVAWELARLHPSKFPPSPRTVRRALAKRGQK